MGNSEQADRLFLNVPSQKQSYEMWAHELARDYPPQFCGRVLRLRKQLLNANGPISSEPSLHLALGPNLMTIWF